MYFKEPNSKLADIMAGWFDHLDRGRLYGFGLSKAIGLDSVWLPDLAWPLAGIFDNDRRRWHTMSQGLEVLPPPPDFSGGPIKIVVFNADYPAVEAQLTAAGLREGFDFLPYNYLASMFMLLRKGRVFLAGGLSQIVTTQCTLNCEHCVSSINLMGRRRSFDLEDLKAGLALLFGRADYVRHLGFVGGEPLVHPHLTELVEFAGRRYAGRFLELVVITNGSIAPAPALLDQLREHSGRFLISDYRSAGIKGYDRRLAETLRRLEAGSIAYELVDKSWRKQICDCGCLDSLSRPELENHYRQCAVREQCAGLAEGRLYYCPTPWFAEKSGRYANVSEAFLDLAQLRPDDADDRMSLVRHFQGHRPDGPPSFCRHCHGGDPAFLMPVPKARQIPDGGSQL